MLGNSSGSGVFVGLRRSRRAIADASSARGYRSSDGVIAVVHAGAQKKIKVVAPDNGEKLAFKPVEYYIKLNSNHIVFQKGP